MRNSPQRRSARSRTLAAIAAFKLFKAALLFAIGFGLIRLLNPFVEARLVHWARSLAWSYDKGIVQDALSFITGLSAAKLKALGIGAFLIGILFTVEGIGLWLEKRWAEYMTLAVTASFLPVELFELLRRFSDSRLAGFGINLAIVAYLIVVVRRARTSAHDSTTHE